MSKLFFVLLICNFFSVIVFGQLLLPKNKPFHDGELLEYDVFYKWGFIYVDAGWAKFSVKLDNYNQTPSFHFKGYGRNKPNWDWFYKVNDVYESFTDTATLRPYRYVRNSNDGGFWVFSDTHFDLKNNIAYSQYLDKKKPFMRKDTVKINFLTFDPITMIYYARSLNFSNMKPGDAIPITLYLDYEVFYKSIRFLGYETIDTPWGKMRCVKFKPSLVPGTLFKEGDEMTVWVSDDKNKVPVLIETPILVGSIKAYLKKASGTLYPAVYNQNAGK